MNLKKLKLVTFFATLFFIMFDCFAAMDSEEAAAFAGFIQDLIHTTQTSKRGVICAVGSDEVSKAMVGQDKTIIDLDKDPKKYLSCKAIYIAMGRQKGLGAEIAKFNKSKIMTIAIFDGFTEMGGMVRVELGRRNFELTLNSKEYKAAGVKLNALSTSLVINTN
jgi:hypothetical protein